MDDLKINILNDFEEEIRENLQNYRLQIKSFSIEDLIDISFGNFGKCLDYTNLKRAKRQIMLINSYLFHYAYSQKHKATKADNDKFNYQQKTIIKKIEEFKNLLWDREELPEDKEIQILHSILDKMLLDPYSYAKPPKDIPVYSFKKSYIEDKIVMILSDRFDHHKCVRTVKRVLLQIDELLKKY